MTSETKNDPRLDVLIKEHAITCSQIHEMVNYSDKMVSISLAGIGLAFTYGVKESSAVAIVALPFIALGLLAYFCSVFYSIAVLGGYRKYLEEEINKYTGLPALCWEKVTSKMLHNSIPAIGIVTILGLLYVSLCAVAWGSVGETAGEQVTRLIKVAYVGGGLFLSAASLSLRSGHQKSYELAKSSVQ